MPIFAQSTGRPSQESSQDNTRERDHEAFVALLTTHRSKLRGIRVHVRVAGARGGQWRKKPLQDFACPTVDELKRAAGDVEIDDDLRDETPEELADIIEKYCSEYADKEGPTAFKCVVYDENGKVLDDCKLTFSDGLADSNDDTETRSSLLDVQLHTIKTMHGLYLVLMQRTCDLVKVVSESPFAAAAVRKVETDAEVAKHQADTIVEEQRVRQYGSALNKVVEQVAPKIGTIVDVMAEHMRQKSPEAASGPTPPPPRPTFAKRLSNILRRSDTAKIHDIIPTEYELLYEASLQADDATFCNICLEFKARVPFSKMVQISEILGPELHTELLALFSEAGVL